MAATAGSSHGTPIDLYGDLNQNDEDGDFDKTAEASDLYDAVLTGSVDQVKEVPSKVVTSLSKDTAAKEESIASTLISSNEVKSLKKHALYVGNFPWWTSDRDLIYMARTLGVVDIREIKFAENKANGQSRGYAEIVVSSEESLQKLLHKIPQCELHGETLNCRFATRENLTMFMDTANKRLPLRVNSKDSTDSIQKIPSLLSQASNKPPPTIPPLFPTHPLANTLPSLSSPFLSHLPPPFPHVPPNIPPPPVPPLFPLQSVHVPGQPSPSLHINPAFFTPGHDSHSSKAYSQQKHTPQTSDADFEELMNRNRAVASTAITKAVSGATTGDLRVAMETLLTAIAVIKQSRVYGDERCQALVTSLKDCLVSIQGNYGYRDSRRSSDRDRDRDRDQDRGRDRERDRDREDSYGREGSGTSRRHRERSWSGERDRDRVRERERHRDHRDRYH
ncbi:cleavage and polyadenylation specificity factor subunit 7-like [Myripristis murdjan]|uniref:Cleavage and polyadenylation specific factor 7 n=1 Tax=Myripristis murdjan TaxID=586833 RepID=A0A667WGK4_9TELE|nr:cleavage and polyadenylation specificity factor subunit 7-like [Myripristis murdjan]XP_029904006.1 cleavage and polyadenylation specificity factor subunit 7-like [Myripristis murdjan]